MDFQPRSFGVSSPDPLMTARAAWAAFDLNGLRDTETTLQPLGQVVLLGAHEQKRRTGFNPYTNKRHDEDALTHSG